MGGGFRRSSTGGRATKVLGAGIRSGRGGYSISSETGVFKISTIYSSLMLIPIPLSLEELPAAGDDTSLLDDVTLCSGDDVRDSLPSNVVYWRVAHLKIAVANSVSVQFVLEPSNIRYILAGLKAINSSDSSRLPSGPE